MKYPLALLLAMLIPGASFGAIIIDDFSVGSALGQTGAGTATNTTTDTGLLGGQRDESVTVRDLGGSEALATILFNGNFVFSQGSNDQAYGSLTYDNFSSFDLTDGGANTHISMGFRTNDIDMDIPNVVSVTAVSGLDSSTQSLSIPASSLLPLDVHVDFADFAPVDFSQLDSIALSFDTASAAGRDFELDFFSGTDPLAVPEPSSIALFALAAVVAMFRRRR